MSLFRIYVDGALFYHPQMSKLAITAARIEEDAENIDSMTLSAPYNHPYLSAIRPLASTIVCKKGNAIVFEGRALDNGTDFYNTHTWTCESCLAYLKDTKSCFLVRGFDPETIGTFETLPEALDAGYRLCRRCDPILRQYQKEQTAILDYCRENGMSVRLNDRYLSIISPISQWRVTVGPSGTTMLYHKNTEFRASDAASAIRGYHNQRISFKSLLQHFTYITSHDAFRMHHPEAPRAALAQNPPKQKEPPRKGTKRWHKEQTRRRAAERRRAIRNVLALIDSLDSGYAARPAV